jgi:hypothetical protein
MMTSMRIFLSAGLSTLLAFVVACGDDTASGGGGNGGTSSNGGGGSTSDGGGGSTSDGGGGSTDGGGGSVADGGGGSVADGGGGGGAGFTLQFDGTGYGPHNGEVLHVIVRNAAGAEVDSGDTAAIAGGNFSITFDNVDAEGGNVDYYVDLNDDNTCGPTAGKPDHVWRDPIPASHTLAVTHNTNFSQVACDGFP